MPTHPIPNYSPHVYKSSKNDINILCTVLADLLGNKVSAMYNMLYIPIYIIISSCEEFLDISFSSKICFNQEMHTRLPLIWFSGGWRSKNEVQASTPISEGPTTTLSFTRRPKTYLHILILWYIHWLKSEKYVFRISIVQVHYR